jgi:hypothetical protein
MLKSKNVLILLAFFGVAGVLSSLIKAIEPQPKPSAPVAEIASPSPSPSPRPPIPPAMLALGEKVAKRVDSRSTAWGTGMPGTSALTTLPKPAWEKLSKTEKAALTYYAEAQVAVMKKSPADFVGKMPIMAPGYDKAIWRVKLMCDSCWVLMVGAGSSGSYGLDETVVQGEAVWERAKTENEPLAERADLFRAKMLAPIAPPNPKS